MRKLAFLAAILTLALIGLTRSASAQADVNRTNQESAAAAFFSSDGCVVTTVDVIALRETDESPHAPSGDPVGGLFLAITRFDTCNGVLLMEGFGSVPGLDFGLDRTLESAAVSAVVPIEETVSGQTFDVAVDMSWVATSHMLAQHENSHFRDPATGVILNTQFHGTFRIAIASGSVLLPDGTNLTPEPDDVFARLAIGSFGSITIG